MVEITLDTEKFQYISTFSNIVGVSPADVEINEDCVVFFLPDRNYFEALSRKNRVKIRILENLLKKKIILKPFSFDPINFVRILLRGVQINDIYIAEKDDGTKILRIILSKKKRINPFKLKKVRNIIKKYFTDIDDVLIAFE